MEKYCSCNKMQCSGLVIADGRQVLHSPELLEVK